MTCQLNAPIDASTASHQAGIHTPLWEERKSFPIFVLKAFACLLIFAPGNVDASGDASIVNVRHLIRLNSVVEVLVWLRTWLLARVDLARHAGKSPRRKSGMVDEEFNPRATGRRILSFPTYEVPEAIK